MSAKQITVTQHIAASCEQVYAALTDAELLAQWWWPHIGDTRYAVDARADGHYEIHSEAVGIGVRGRFLVLDAPNYLRLSWIWMNAGVSAEEEDVEIRLSPDANGCQLALTHHLSPDAGDGADLRQGWSDVFARLATLLSN